MCRGWFCRVDPGSSLGIGSSQSSADQAWQRAPLYSLAPLTSPYLRDAATSASFRTEVCVEAELALAVGKEEVVCDLCLEGQGSGTGCVRDHAA